MVHATHAASKLADCKRGKTGIFSRDAGTIRGCTIEGTEGQKSMMVKPERYTQCKKPEPWKSEDAHSEGKKKFTRPRWAVPPQR